MTEQELEIMFEKALSIADTIPQESLPQDIQLRLYAYYKQATFGNLTASKPRETYHLRDAFKINAWMQVSHISIQEAKQQYIEIINSLINKNEK
jgi:acyl-CoA-binding protein